MAAGRSNHHDISYLVCAECTEYLSCGPIYTKKDTRSLCGRCEETPSRGIRNVEYEIVCKNIRFPCKFRYFGCRVRQHFAESWDLSHESTCPYRPLKCIVDKICRWKHLKSRMADHCRNSHPDHLLLNCSTFQLKISHMNEFDYFVIAFEMEFLLQTKVYLSESDNKITFQLDYLGYQVGAPKFHYILNVKKDRSLVTKTGICMTFPMLCELEIDDLIDLFGGMEGVNFQLTIFIKCHRCRQEILYGKLYKSGTNWNCSKCSPRSKSCEENSCSFVDNPIKIGKHEYYFCKNSTNLLGVLVLSTSNDWTIKKPTDKCAFTTDIGQVLCKFTSIKTDKFEVFLYSPLRSDQLKKYSCQIKIGNHNSGEIRYFRPKFEMKKEYDWYVWIKKTDYPSWEHEIRIRINIERLDAMDLYDNLNSTLSFD